MIQIRRAAAIITLLTATAASSYGQGNAEPVRSKSIEVSGVGVAYGAPTLARVQIGVQSRASDVKAALAKNAENMRAVISALESAGVAEKDIATSEYQVIHQSGESVPGGQQSPSPPERGAGYYEVTTSVTVTVRELGRLGTILDDSFAAGANLAGGISFGVSDPAALEAIARARAFGDAKGRAEQLAKLAGVRLGRAERITEMTGRPPIGPAFAGALAAPGLAPPVSGGELAVQVSLEVIFPVE